jgi:hypothetical protein
MSILTNDQQFAFKKVQEFLESDDNSLVILGSAGTGKSFLTKHISDYISDNTNKKLVAIAPTHKARRVLSKFLNKDTVKSIPDFTVASMLGKMKQHTYIGSHEYSRGSNQKMDIYDIFILDEVSMVSSKDTEQIVNYIKKYNKKIIFIGDPFQIPSPSQALIKHNNICLKPDNMVFSFENKAVLTEIVRQAKESPIIKMATFIRNNINVDIDLKDILNKTEIDHNEICVDQKEALESFIDDWNNYNDYSTRLVTYTNVLMKSYNIKIRKSLEFNESLVIGDLMTGYNNVGYPIPKIENGIDYIVTKIQPTTNYMIDVYDGLVGNLVNLQDLDNSSRVSRKLFFVLFDHSANKEFMKSLILFAQKVNKPYSTKEDYKNYTNLKNRAIFMDDVYKYKNDVLTMTDMKQLHPLLFTKIDEVINTTQRIKRDSELVKKIENNYPNIISKRLNDTKLFADNEMLVDKYMVIEKDIFYGYACTTHKVQGSTYRNVYVDDNDFKKISDKWNYRYKMMEIRVKERNQLRYVAYTRASEKLRIIV